MVKNRKRLLCTIVAALTLAGCGESGTAPKTSPTIAVQIDVDQVDAAVMERMAAELEARGIPATLFAPPQVETEREVVYELYLKHFEIALLADEPASMDYSTQRSHILEAKQRVEGCLKCGTYAVPVVGFRPRGFAQSQDTFQALETLNFAYSAGFEAQRIYAATHEEDTLPYFLEGYRLAAVPVSAAMWEGESIGLSAATCQERGLGPEAWEELLTTALEDARAGNGLLVAVINTGAAAAEDSPYWTSFLDFLDRARQNDARFLTTHELVLEYAGH